MQPLITLIGLVAAFATAGANLPQVLKCWRTRDTEALSTRMLLLLSAGLASWIVYGVLRGDPVVVLANLISIALSVTLLVLKARNGWH